MKTFHLPTWFAGLLALSLLGCQNADPPRLSGGTQFPNWNRPIAELDAAVKDHPDISQVYIDRGVYYFINGKPGMASDDLTRALQIDPTNFDALYRRAAAYEEQGFHEIAEQDLRQAKLLDPEVQRQQMMYAASRPVFTPNIPTVAEPVNAKQLAVSSFSVNDIALGQIDPIIDSKTESAKSSSEFPTLDRWQEEKSRPAVSADGSIQPFTRSWDITSSTDHSQREEKLPSVSQPQVLQPPTTPFKAESSRSELSSRKDKSRGPRDDIKVSPSLVKAQIAFQKDRQPRPNVGVSARSHQPSVSERDSVAAETLGRDIVLPPPGSDFFNR